MKYIKYILAVFLLSYSSFLSAQITNKYNRHEVYFTAGAGYYVLDYNVQAQSKQSDAGGAVGLGYTYFFHRNWGISTGIEGSYYNAKLKLHDFTSVISGLNDGEGHTFDFHSTVRNYSEKQKTYIVSIPIMATYQTGKFNRFYVFGGMKIGLPFGKYESNGTFVNKGYFPERHNWAIDQRFMGFGVFENEKNDDKVKYNPSFVLALEVGAKWYSNGDWFIYSGFYGEYGLNNIIKAGDKGSFISYRTNPDQIYTNGSVLMTEYINEDNQLVTFTDKVRPFSIGIRVRVALGW